MVNKIMKKKNCWQHTSNDNETAKLHNIFGMGQAGVLATF